MKEFLRRHTLGVQARLTMLALVTALPLVALASFAILRGVDDQRAQMQRDVRERVENLLTDVDRQISAIQAELQVLATSPNLQAGDFLPFDRQMRDALKIQGTAIVLLDTKAQQLINTNRPFGEPLPRATNSEMHDRVVATGKPQISDLIIGAVLRRPVLTVGVPVFRDGEVIYVLVMVLGPEILSALLQEQNLSPDWTAAIFDRKGLTVARTRDLDRFIGQPAAPILLKEMMGAAESWFPNVTKDGLAVYSTFRRSPISGWTVAIGLPREFVDGPLRRAQWIAFGGGAAALVLSLALAGWMARAIRRPVEALTTATKALGAGEPLAPLIGGVRELDEVGNALRSTAAGLVRSREQLEIMVAERTQELASANDRLRAEIGAREQAQAELLQAQKMEAMGQLTGGVAHDFNNLLTAVSGSLALLEPRISDERSLRLLRTAQRGASRGAKLTESLLAFARKQRLDPVPADLNAIVVDMSEMLRRSIGPFFTTKEIGKGTGLGLSMVFGVVRQSGGAVGIRSRLREGTTVQIYLARTMEPRALGSHFAIDAGVAEMAHILVVDDDPDVRWITAEDLREIGYVVAEADGGRAALAILERDDPCDLMLVDLVMTGLTGVDTVRLVRRARPDLKVLFCSGYADMSRFEKDIGDEVLLKKPFRRDTLAEAVRAALQPVAASDTYNIVPLRRSEPS